MLACISLWLKSLAQKQWSGGMENEQSRMVVNGAHTSTEAVKLLIFKQTPGNIHPPIQTMVLPPRNHWPVEQKPKGVWLSNRFLKLLNVGCCTAFGSRLIGVCFLIDYFHLGQVPCRYFKEQLGIAGAWSFPGHLPFLSPSQQHQSTERTIEISL